MNICILMWKRTLEITTLFYLILMKTDQICCFNTWLFGTCSSSSTLLSSCASIWPMRNSNNSLTTTCSSWNKRSTNVRALSGISSTLVLICFQPSSSLRRYWLYCFDNSYNHNYNCTTRGLPFTSEEKVKLKLSYISRILPSLSGQIDCFFRVWM